MSLTTKRDCPQYVHSTVVTARVFYRQLISLKASQPLIPLKTIFKESQESEVKFQFSLNFHSGTYNSELYKHKFIFSESQASLSIRTQQISNHQECLFKTKFLEFFHHYNIQPESKITLQKHFEASNRYFSGKCMQLHTLPTFGISAYERTSAFRFLEFSF